MKAKFWNTLQVGDCHPVGDYVFRLVEEGKLVYFGPDGKDKEVEKGDVIDEGLPLYARQVVKAILYR